MQIQNQFEQTLDSVLTTLCTTSPKLKKDLKEIGPSLKALFQAPQAAALIKKNKWEGRAIAALETIASLDFGMYLEMPTVDGQMLAMNSDIILPKQAVKPTQAGANGGHGVGNGTTAMGDANSYGGGGYPPGAYNSGMGYGGGMYGAVPPNAGYTGQMGMQCPGRVEKKNRPKCRTEEADQLMQSDILAQIEKRKVKVSEYQYEGLSRALNPLKGIFSRTPMSKKKYVIDALTGEMRNSAVERYPEIFSSTLYYFIQNSISSVFAEEPKVYASMERMETHGGPEGYVQSAALVSSHPLPDSNLSAYGFYLKPIDEIAKVQPIKKTSVNICGREYEVEYKIEQMQKPLYNPNASPDYKKLWEDGKLTGVVVEGVGFYRANVSQNYLNYYRQQGFEFGEPVKADGNGNKSAQMVLKELISSGEADYLVRDSHSGADLVNVLTYNKNAQIIRGEKKLENGKTEVVYIVAAEKSKPEQIVSGSNIDDYRNKLQPEDLKEYMAKRTNPMILLNGSCSSMAKVVQQVYRLQDPKLVNIGFSTNTLSFTNRDESTKKLFLDGLRQGKTYQEMRDNMRSKSKRYATDDLRLRKDVIIFPDDPVYDKALTSFKFDLRYQIRVQDDYSIWGDYELSDAVSR